MKKLVDPLSTGGAPIFATETLSEVLTTEVWDAMESLFNLLEGQKYYNYTVGSGGGIILSGVDVTPQGGNLYDLTAGIVFHPAVGIARFAGATGVSSTSSIYLNPSTPTIEQKTFADASSKDYTTTIITELSTSVGLVGNASIAVLDNAVVYRPTLDNILSQLTGDTITSRFTITDWDMNTDAVFTFNLPSLQGPENKLRIVKAECWVRQDGTTSQQYVNLERPASGGTEYGYIEIIGNDGLDNGFVVNLNRITGGFFDASSFSAVGTRGYLTITYAMTP